MPIKFSTLKKYLSDAFVETGSYYGDGIDASINAGFTSIYSIELSDKYFNICKNRYAENNRVHLVHGDSGLILYDVIKDIDTRITFWLDGHYSGEDTACGMANNPALLELGLIKNHHIKNHIILIDDLRTYNDSELRAKILEINEGYKFYYEDGHCPKDILVAML